jgi:hypothetical protein
MQSSPQRQPPPAALQLGCCSQLQQRRCHASCHKGRQVYGMCWKQWPFTTINLCNMVGAELLQALPVCVQLVCVVLTGRPRCTDLLYSTLQTATHMIELTEPAHFFNTCKCVCDACGHIQQLHTVWDYHSIQVAHVCSHQQPSTHAAIGEQLP